MKGRVAQILIMADRGSLSRSSNALRGGFSVLGRPLCNRSLTGSAANILAAIRTATLRVAAATYRQQASGPTGRLLCNRSRCGSESRDPFLRDQFVNNLPLDIGEPKIPSGVAERELLVIEPEQRENRGV